MMGKPVRWRKVQKNERQKAEAFLRERERFCVTACTRFLGAKTSHGHVWYLSEEAEISALLLNFNRTLFPVFGKMSRVSSPKFLNRFLGKVPIHAIQGLQKDAELLETLMKEQGYFAAEWIDYDLMCLDTCPLPETFGTGPAGLILRPPVPRDMESLFVLQSAYEQEEVLPANSVFNPAVCRLNLEHILSRERVLVAELNGQTVGKINTSAESFTRYQIGGVYVHPAYRGLGIGTKMTAVFAHRLLSLGKGLTLFVKKRNTAAKSIYLKTGFTVLADYRITYY
jgi:ribosomal protein S18 acetylase RimI-like enzyme